MFRDPKFTFLSVGKTCLYKTGALGILNQFSRHVTLTMPEYITVSATRGPAHTVSRRAEGVNNWFVCFL